MQSTPPGFGQIELHSVASHAVLSQLVSSYPLKLLSPRTPHPNVAVVYVLTYGGGLVAGDHVSLHAEVHDRAVLVLLTQGSTKVFKTRPGGRSARPTVALPVQTDSTITSQTLDVHIAPHSALFLLPDPVTCFRAASYNQRQTFRLADPSASAVLLDWLTAGRPALGEAWSFARYYSLNELFVSERRVARDALLLEDPYPLNPSSHASTSDNCLPKRTLADRLSPYTCYATVLIYGPLTDATRRALQEEFDGTSVFRRARAPELIWSVTPLGEGRGCVLRVAAEEAEAVREWLRTRLAGLKEVVGGDVYRNAFG